MADLDLTVIGGGIVGCAVAAEAARRGLSTALLEKEGDLARGTTSRNSQVSHGGMYYPAGSRKAHYCVRGRRLLKKFCLEHGVDYQECGKLIVAVEEAELPELERLLNLGQANEVEDLVLIDGEALKKLEPDIRAVAGLFSPRTGILDPEGAARAYAHQARENGAQIMTAAQVTGLERHTDGWLVQVEPSGTGRADGWTHTSTWVVNAAGLRADLVAVLAGVDIEARRWRQTLLKGNYFKLAPRHAGRFRHLVYPVPPADGSSLGVHVCLDLDGQLRLGPDTQEAETPLAVRDLPGDGLDYGVDPARGNQFFEAARRFLPWLEAEDLVPDMSGYRPKLVVKGFRDFEICREEGDLEGLINLVGIESPGLTSAAAMAEDVGRMLAGEV
nr:NAD(P)/FAD-dependent oxidoreductase [Candidatus Krumholzibacteria bacterium]